MRLYLVRHGESESNKAGCYTGHWQVHLTEEGVRQAEGLREYLSKFSFDRVYSSDLYRALETAEAAFPGCCPEQTQLLRELNLGSLQGRRVDSLSEEELKIKASLGFKGFGGESNEELRARAKEFLDLVIKSGDENVLAFTHQGILTFALAAALGFDISWKHLVLRNCAIMILNHTGTSWRLEGLINRE